MNRLQFRPLYYNHNSYSNSRGQDPWIKYHKNTIALFRFRDNFEALNQCRSNYVATWCTTYFSHSWKVESGQKVAGQKIKIPLSATLGVEGYEPFTPTPTLFIYFVLETAISNSISVTERFSVWQPCWLRCPFMADGSFQYNRVGDRG